MGRRTRRHYYKLTNNTMQDYTKLTLGQLLASTNETIRRNAMSILKTLQKQTPIKPIRESQA